MQRVSTFPPSFPPVNLLVSVSNWRAHLLEQLVALLISVGLQLHDRIILLDEFEQLGGVQLRIPIVVGLQNHTEKGRGTVDSYEQ